MERGRVVPRKEATYRRSVRHVARSGKFPALGASPLIGRRPPHPRRGPPDWDKRSKKKEERIHFSPFFVFFFSAPSRVSARRRALFLPLTAEARLFDPFALRVDLECVAAPKTGQNICLCFATHPHFPKRCSFSGFLKRRTLFENVFFSALNFGRRCYPAIKISK